jgi:hypothetical protein
VLRRTGEPEIIAKEHIMKIAVAGATGRLGRHVAEVLTERGRQVVAISRATGVDIITGSGLEAALDGAEVIVDAATSPSPDGQTATEFFVTAARNLQQAGVRAGVMRAVVVSIINIDKFTGGYGAAKIAHEDAWRRTWWSWPGCTPHVTGRRSRSRASATRPGSILLACHLPVNTNPARLRGRATRLTSTSGPAGPRVRTCEATR